MSIRPNRYVVQSSAVCDAKISLDIGLIIRNQNYDIRQGYYMRQHFDEECKALFEIIAHHSCISYFLGVSLDSVRTWIAHWVQNHTDLGRI